MLHILVVHSGELTVHINIHHALPIKCKTYSWYSVEKYGNNSMATVRLLKNPKSYINNSRYNSNA